MCLLLKTTTLTSLYFSPSSDCLLPRNFVITLALPCSLRCSPFCVALPSASPYFVLPAVLSLCLPSAFEQISLQYLFRISKMASYEDLLAPDHFDWADEEVLTTASFHDYHLPAHLHTSLQQAHPPEATTTAAVSPVILPNKKPVSERVESSAEGGCTDSNNTTAVLTTTSNEMKGEPLPRNSAATTASTMIRRCTTPLVGVTTPWVLSPKSTTSTGLATQSTKTARLPRQTLSPSSQRTLSSLRFARMSGCTPSSAAHSSSLTPW